jgi:hypothetical protein
VKERIGKLVNEGFRDGVKDHCKAFVIKLTATALGGFADVFVPVMSHGHIYIYTRKGNSTEKC